MFCNGVMHGFRFRTVTLIAEENEQSSVTSKLLGGVRSSRGISRRKCRLLWTLLQVCNSVASGSVSGPAETTLKPQTYETPMACVTCPRSAVSAAPLVSLLAANSTYQSEACLCVHDGALLWVRMPSADFFKGTFCFDDRLLSVIPLTPREAGLQRVHIDNKGRPLVEDAEGRSFFPVITRIKDGKVSVELRPVNPEQRWPSSLQRQQSKGIETHQHDDGPFTPPPATVTRNVYTFAIDHKKYPCYKYAELEVQRQGGKLDSVSMLVHFKPELQASLADTWQVIEECVNHGAIKEDDVMDGPTSFSLDDNQNVKLSEGFEMSTGSHTTGMERDDGTNRLASSKDNPSLEQGMPTTSAAAQTSLARKKSASRKKPPKRPKGNFANKPVEFIERTDAEGKREVVARIWLRKGYLKKLYDVYQEGKGIQLHFRNGRRQTMHPVYSADFERPRFRGTKRCVIPVHGTHFGVGLNRSLQPKPGADQQYGFNLRWGFPGFWWLNQLLLHHRKFHRLHLPNAYQPSSELVEELASRINESVGLIRAGKDMMGRKAGPLYAKPLACGGAKDPVWKKVDRVVALGGITDRLVEYGSKATQADYLYKSVSALRSKRMGRHLEGNSDRDLTVEEVIQRTMTQMELMPLNTTVSINLGRHFFHNLGYATNHMFGFNYFPSYLGIILARDHKRGITLFKKRDDLTKDDALALTLSDDCSHLFLFCWTTTQNPEYNPTRTAWLFETVLLAEGGMNTMWQQSETGETVIVGNADRISKFLAFFNECVKVDNFKHIVKQFRAATHLEKTIPLAPPLEKTEFVLPPREQKKNNAPPSLASNPTSSRPARPKDIESKDIEPEVIPLQRLGSHGNVLAATAAPRSQNRQKVVRFADEEQSDDKDATTRQTAKAAVAAREFGTPHSSVKSAADFVWEVINKEKFRIVKRANMTFQCNLRCTECRLQGFILPKDDYYFPFFGAVPRIAQGYHYCFEVLGRYITRTQEHQGEQLTIEQQDRFQGGKLTVNPVSERLFLVVYCRPTWCSPAVPSAIIGTPLASWQVEAGEHRTKTSQLYTIKKTDVEATTQELVKLQQEHPEWDLDLELLPMIEGPFDDSEEPGEKVIPVVQDDEGNHHFCSPVTVDRLRETAAEFSGAREISEASAAIQGGLPGGGGASRHTTNSVAAEFSLPLSRRPALRYHSMRSMRSPTPGSSLSKEESHSRRSLRSSMTQLVEKAADTYSLKDVSRQLSTNTLHDFEKQPLTLGMFPSEAALRQASSSTALQTSALDRMLKSQMNEAVAKIVADSTDVDYKLEMPGPGAQLVALQEILRHKDPRLNALLDTLSEYVKNPDKKEPPVISVNPKGNIGDVPFSASYFKAAGYIFKGLQKAKAALALQPRYPDITPPPTRCQRRAANLGQVLDYVYMNKDIPYITREDWHTMKFEGEARARELAAKNSLKAQTCEVITNAKKEKCSQAREEAFRRAERRNSLKQGDAETRRARFMEQRKALENLPRKVKPLKSKAKYGCVNDPQQPEWIALRGALQRWTDAELFSNDAIENTLSYAAKWQVDRKQLLALVQMAERQIQPDITNGELKDVGRSLMKELMMNLDSVTLMRNVTHTHARGMFDSFMLTVRSDARVGMNIPLCEIKVKGPGVFDIKMHRAFDALILRSFIPFKNSDLAKGINFG